MICKCCGKYINVNHVNALKAKCLILSLIANGEELGIDFCAECIIHINCFDFHDFDSRGKPGNGSANIL